MNDTKTFVRMKYSPMSDDRKQWEEICAAMPMKARVSWALRCAKDVSHLAKDIPEVQKCIDVIELWLDDKATTEEMKEAAYSGATAVGAAVDAAATKSTAAVASAANTAAYSTAYSDAVDAAAYAVNTYANAATRITKWNLYKEWYWEELEKWEEKQ